MSRVGGAPIILPSGVRAEVEGQKVKISGPKGDLEVDFRSEIKVIVEDGKVLVSRKKDERLHKSLHGLTRSLINNAVVGVSTGWVKNLELVGVGYRAQGGGDQITLSVGFSHPVVVKASPGTTLAVAENTKLSVSGIDRHLVGQMAANIRAVKPPEVYKGKGIRYTGERVRRKAGKAGKAAGAK